MSHRVLSQREMISVINNTPVCDLAMTDKCMMPYIVPMYFLYSREERLPTFYFITENNSQKNDILKANPKTSLLFVTRRMACTNQTSNGVPTVRFTYNTVIADGLSSLISNSSQVDYVYNRLLEKSQQDRAFLQRNIRPNDASAIKVTIGNMTGRQYIF